MKTDSFNGCNQVVVLPDRGKFGRNAATEHHEHAIAGTQIVEFARYDEHRLALFAYTMHDGKQRLFRFHIDAGGRIDQHELVGIGRKCASHHDLLLVAAGQSRHHVVRSRRDDAERVDHLAAERALLRERRDAKVAESTVNLTRSTENFASKVGNYRQSRTQFGLRRGAINIKNADELGFV